MKPFSHANRRPDKMTRHTFDLGTECIVRNAGRMLHHDNKLFTSVRVNSMSIRKSVAPPYLNDLVCVADLPGRRRLRSSSSRQLLVPSFQLTAIGRRTFPVAASLLWNSLPIFRQRLKPFFTILPPSIALRLRGLRNSSAILDTLKMIDNIIHSMLGSSARPT